MGQFFVLDVAFCLLLCYDFYVVRVIFFLATLFSSKDISFNGQGKPPRASQGDFQLFARTLDVSRFKNFSVREST